MFLLTVKLVKNSHIYATNFFMLLESVLKQTWNSFNANLEPQWKDRKTSYQVRQIFGHFCLLIALILVWGSVKGLRVMSNNMSKKLTLKKSGAR